MGVVIHAITRELDGLKYLLNIYGALLKSLNDLRGLRLGKLIRGHILITRTVVKHECRHCGSAVVELTCLIRRHRSFLNESIFNFEHKFLTDLTDNAEFSTPPVDLRFKYHPDNYFILFLSHLLKKKHYSITMIYVQLRF